MDNTPANAPERHWYVMRDLKRANSKSPAYLMLAEHGVEVFVPMKQVVLETGGRKVKTERPYITDLLFVNSAPEQLDPIVDKTPTLQYRYVKGGGYCQPMVVRDDEMNDFMAVVRANAALQYYAPDELSDSIVGRRVRIVGGNLDGVVGNVMKVRGAHKKRVMVRLQNLIAASAVIDSDFIEFID